MDMKIWILVSIVILVEVFALKVAMVRQGGSLSISRWILIVSLVLGVMAFAAGVTFFLLKNGGF